MPCLTTSATLRSRRVCAAVLIADAAASSHESLLVPISSVTRYTLTRTHSFNLRRSAQPRSRPLGQLDSPCQTRNSQYPPDQDLLGDHDLSLGRCCPRCLARVGGL